MNEYFVTLSSNRKKSSKNTLSSFENEKPIQLKKICSENNDDEWSVGLYSIVCNPLHQYKLDEDQIFLTKMYNEETSVSKPITLENFLRFCMKYSYNPEIYTNNSYFDKFLNYNCLKSFPINFESVSDGKATLLSIEIEINIKDTHFFNINFNFGKNKKYNLKQILIKILLFSLEKFKEHLTLIDDKKLTLEKRKEMTLIDGKNHPSHLNASLLFTIIDVFIELVLFNVKNYLVKKYTMNNIPSFSKQVYVKTNIIEENFLKVLLTSELKSNYKQFHNIEYIPIKKKFDNIKIDFSNEFNDDNIFADDFSDTIVTLHFKKHVKSLESDEKQEIISVSNNNENNIKNNVNRKRKRNVYTPITSLIDFE